MTNMTMQLESPAAFRTMADLSNEMGDIPPERILLNPAPGTATEQDVLDLDDHHDRLCELIDGVLVEKIMSSRESILAVAIASLLHQFIAGKKLGFVLGEGGMLRLRPQLVLIPDVAFVARKSLPGGKFPDDAIAPIAPDLAIEVLSKGNTPAEMARKRKEYFAAGTRLVWEINPKGRSVKAYSAPDKFTLLTHNQSLDGAPVLRGLKINLRELFAELD